MGDLIIFLYLINKIIIHTVHITVHDTNGFKTI